jgi:hypothetical protein
MLSISWTMRSVLLSSVRNTSGRATPCSPLERKRAENASCKRITERMFPVDRYRWIQFLQTDNSRNVSSMQIMSYRFRLKDKVRANFV